MAYNSASSNPIGAKTGPASEPPPPASQSTLDAITAASKNDALGHRASGQDGALYGKEHHIQAVGVIQPTDRDKEAESKEKAEVVKAEDEIPESRLPPGSGGDSHSKPFS